MTGKRVAVITGGAMGIGAAVSRSLAATGDAVVIADRDQEWANKTAADLQSAELSVEAVAIDV